MSGAPPGPVLIALSGGGDSVALLHELADRGAGARLIAGVVDHGVRGESAAEARQAAAWAEALGVKAHIVTLAWPEGAARPNAARLRQRRHAAVCALARAHGAGVIALAHTADDQLETFLMRLETARHWRELAGMDTWAPAPLWPEGRGIRLWRPLLARRRADLRAALRARGAAWIDDPSNDAIESARARARRHCAALAAGGYPMAPLLAAMARLRARAEAEDRAAAAWIGAAVTFEAGRAACARLPADHAVAARALSVLIAACAGAPRLPERAGVARVLARTGRAATLGGARLTWRDGAVLIGRDPGAVLGRRGVAPLAPLALDPGVEAIWDNRLAVTARAPGWRIAPCAAGAERAAPVFLRGDEALTLKDARGAGLVAADWLTAERVNHILPPARGALSA